MARSSRIRSTDQQHSVAKSVGCSGELVGYGRVHIRIVAIVRADQSIEGGAENAGQKLAVENGLDLCPHDLPRLLEYPVTAPTPVHRLEGTSDPRKESDLTYGRDQGDQR